MKKRNAQYLMLLLFSMFTGSMFAQQEVSGVVSSDDGELLPGVSVVIKGTSTGVSTDFDGNYSISVPNNQSVLVFSYIGLETQEQSVGSKTTLNVALKAGAQALDEVVVTALGISREKKSLGYSVGEIDGEALTAVPQENVLNAMAGKISGVAISSTGGPGSSVSMVIRGASSLNTDNQPLFVVDGVPITSGLNNTGGFGKDVSVDYGNAISDLNAEDIESMSVLKGPSAAALYGSRAANGVVVITTKSGKAGKGLAVSINSSTVFDVPYKFVEKHSIFAFGSRPYTPDNNPSGGTLVIDNGTSGWVGPELDKGYNAIQWPFTEEELTSGVGVATPLTSRGKNNAEEFFNTAITTTNSISIEDSSERMNYRLSYTNMTHTGAIPNSDLGRDNISLNSGLQINDKLKVSTSLNFTKSGAKNRPAGDGGDANPLVALFELNHSIDVRDMKNYWREGFEGSQQNSLYKWNGVNTDPSDIKYNNPYFIANEVNNGFDRKRIFGNATADYKFTDKLSLMARYNYNQTNETRETKISSGYRKERNGAYGLQTLKNSEINVDWLLSYNDRFNDNWSLNTSVGGNLRKVNAFGSSAATKDGGAGLILPNIFTLSNIAFDNLETNSTSSEKQVNSIYGLASVGYKNIAYVDITGRNDWSSTLPEDNRSYFYPSVSTSVLLNNIFEMGNSVSLLKLRAGWAQVGNDTKAYNLAPVLGNQGSWGNATLLNQPSSLFNSSLEPEKQTSTEFGIDVALFKSRLHFDATYYEAENENQILPIAASPSSGVTSKLINAGLISSKGFEASIGGDIIRDSNNWNWNMNFVYSQNSTKIVKLTDDITYVNLWGGFNSKAGAVTWEGEEIGNIIGEKQLVRVDDPSSKYHGWPLLDEGWENDKKDWVDADGNRSTPILGNFNPDFTVGMQTQISYKNFKLAMSFDYRKGGQFLSETYRYGESDFHTKRYFEDQMFDLSDVDDIPAYILENKEFFLLPGGQFFPQVGGPTAEYGGIAHTDGGITLNDGAFLPGVHGDYDDNGNFVMTSENIGGPGTITQFTGDFYPWSFAKSSIFDADFLKLRDISLTYMIPSDVVKKLGLQNMSVSLFSRNIILWTKAGINVDPETAFTPGGASDNRTAQGIERYNVSPWVIPVGFKLNLKF